MNFADWFDKEGESRRQALWEDEERVLRRMSHRDADGSTLLVVSPASDHPTNLILDRLAYEFALRDDLDGIWAARPVAFGRHLGRTFLALEDCGEPLEPMLTAPLEIGSFLRLATSITSAVSKMHQSGIIHLDIKPGNILVARGTQDTKLTGFGIASRTSLDQRSSPPPETIAGTLAYMAPEQTGRMNRSVDSRSDLYALGVTFYRMLTGSLPFSANDPWEWIHCHVARTPLAPNALVASVPTTLSNLVLKLLAKMAEDRYQTAAGLHHDLYRCLAEWNAELRIDEFALGDRDISEWLSVPEKLYGRGRELQTLTGAFDRVVSTGKSELVLVSGYSGSGKSALVNELKKSLVASRGFFATGKFDQYKRDIPYSTLAQAFQSMLHTLLAKSETELDVWRSELRNALEPNAKLLADVVPGLRLLMGEPPPAVKLPPLQEQSRLQLLLQRFLGVFARRQSPLVLFLDDLQWLDIATLDLLEHLITKSDVGHVLLIGAYRNNEVSTTHPLMLRLSAFRKTGLPVLEITLAPLKLKDTVQLTADTLHADEKKVEPLALVVHERTGGNPLFAIQLFSELVEERVLAYDHGTGHWGWDLTHIQAIGFSKNVVELLLGKLVRLPVETQNALQQLACVGNSAEFDLLEKIYPDSIDALHGHLQSAVQAGYIVRSDRSYKFRHDRFQEAAYGLISSESRAEYHFRIGKSLFAHTSPSQREEAIFEIVGQYNRGITFINSPAERTQLAELNLIAGKRAKSSAAYGSALAYLETGASLLSEDAWERCRELIFALEFNRAECEFLTGALEQAEVRAKELSVRASDTIEQAAVACLLIELYLTADQSARAVAVGLEYLRRLGIEWTPHPSQEDARREYERIWSMLRDRPIESLIDLPLMNDPRTLATMDVLTKLTAPAWHTDVKLLCLIVSRAVILSIERGNSDASCFSYVNLGLLTGSQYGDYQSGYRFGRLGYDLVELRELKGFQARTLMNYGMIVLPWTQHIRAGRDVVRRAFEVANQIGDLVFAAFCCKHMTTNFLSAGDRLDATQVEAERGVALAQAVGFGVARDFSRTQLALARTLRGLTPVFGSFDDAQFSELLAERHLASNPDLAIAEFIYWSSKLQARLMAEDYVAATDAAARAELLIGSAFSQFELAEYHFYSALAHAASWNFAGSSKRERLAHSVAAHLGHLELWTENCPHNFGCRAALVGAELARIRNRPLEAMERYESAIQAARASDFVHIEALAYELAGRFYAARGFQKISRMYFRDARNRYSQWGAEGKVRQLTSKYMDLDVEKGSETAGTIRRQIEHLDLAMVLKVSQAISGEINIEKLIETLMRTALEQAGARRGLLIIPRESGPHVVAEATIKDDAINVRIGDEPITAFEAPTTVINYVLRTREIIILDDAISQRPFADDAYVRAHNSRSILCLPLNSQTKLIAKLYLENDLGRKVFSPARVAILKLIASQAAVALEIARLYRDLEQRETKIRRLVDANIIGIFIWDFGGRILDANEAFLGLLGYSSDQLRSGRMRWPALTPPEWDELDKSIVAELRATGSCRPYEKEFFRKDGGRVHVLVGFATFDNDQDEGVGFVLDLTDRKRAEAESRANERRYRQIELEVAHANRRATVGELAASVAHEVAQPITGVVASAHAARISLTRDSPDLSLVRRGLDRIIRDSSRAVEVIARIRELIRNGPPQKTRLCINEVIREVLELIRGEIVQNGASVQTALADDPPSVDGDRVQLQQVMINLTLNALQAMSVLPQDRRKLSITTVRTKPNGILVAVKDWGPGLNAEDPDKIFSPFYTTKPEGLGMGLSICKSIIEAHGGRIWATGNTVQGATFEFTLPGNTLTREPRNGL